MNLALNKWGATKTLSLRCKMALYLYQQGLNVYIREDIDGIPLPITDAENE